MNNNRKLEELNEQGWVNMYEEDVKAFIRDNNLEGKVDVFTDDVGGACVQRR